MAKEIVEVSLNKVWRIVKDLKGYYLQKKIKGFWITCKSLDSEFLSKYPEWLVWIFTKNRRYKTLPSAQFVFNTQTLADVLVERDYLKGDQPFIIRRSNGRQN